MTEKTRRVDKTKAKDYLKRAEECANAMRRAFDAHEWSACVITAVHCAISAADAFCIYKDSKRHSGENHQEAVILFRNIGEKDTETENNANRLSRLLSLKSSSAYGEHLMNQKDAQHAMLDAERLLGFVRNRIS